MTEENIKEEIVDFDAVIMKGLSSVELPDWAKKELDEWIFRISKASSEELMTMIVEAKEDYISEKEEALAREFVKRKIGAQKFLETAEFRTTKAILEGRLK